MQIMPSMIFSDVKKNVNGTELKELSYHAFNHPLARVANCATTA